MIDPLALTSIHALDFGSVYTPDGREHPVTGISLPFLSQQLTNSQPSSSNPVDVPTTYPATGPNVPPVSQMWGWLNPDFAKDSHLGARFVVGLVGLIILAIVVARIIK